MFCNHQVALLPGAGADSLDAVVDISNMTTPASLGASYVLALPKLGVKEVSLIGSETLQGLELNYVNL